MAITTVTLCELVRSSIHTLLKRQAVIDAAQESEEEEEVVFGGESVTFGGEEVEW